MYNDEVGKYCRKYRRNILKMTLQEVAGFENLKTLSAFEHGRSTNINHIQKYIRASETMGREQHFINGLVDVLKSGECKY